MSVGTYLQLKKKALVLKDSWGYNLNAGEMNPVIFEQFVRLMKVAELPLTIWEPFAGTSQEGSSEKSFAIDYAYSTGVELISYGLRPRDERIWRVDSTRRGPTCNIGGVLFHPPYFGTSPMSNDINDLSSYHNMAEYTKSLNRVIDNAKGKMEPNGLVCAVGRDYRHDGKRIRLDLILLQLFKDKGFILKDVWISTPDVVLILSNKCITKKLSFVT